MSPFIMDIITYSMPGLKLFNEVEVVPSRVCTYIDFSIDFHPLIMFPYSTQNFPIIYVVLSYAIHVVLILSYCIVTTI